MGAFMCPEQVTITTCSFRELPGTQLCREYSTFVPSLERLGTRESEAVTCPVSLYLVTESRAAALQPAPAFDFSGLRSAGHSLIALFK